MVRTQSDTTFFRSAIISAGVAMSMPCYSPAVEAVIREILESSCSRNVPHQSVDELFDEDFTVEQETDLLRHEQQGSARLTVQPVRIPLR